MRRAGAVAVARGASERASRASVSNPIQRQAGMALVMTDERRGKGMKEAADMSMQSSEHARGRSRTERHESKIDAVSLRGIYCHWQSCVQAKHESFSMSSWIRIACVYSAPS